MAAMHADRKPTITAQGESYSDDENDIIDLEVVPEQSGESAPTGLIRHRSIAAALGDGRKKPVKTEAGAGESTGTRVRDQPVVVKEEPMSPDKQDRALPPVARGKDKGKGPAGRTDDRLTDADMSMDMDVDGNRISQAVEEEKEVTEAKQAIDLDEIVIEDYEEDITGDFVHLEGEVSGCSWTGPSRRDLTLTGLLHRPIPRTNCIFFNSPIPSPDSFPTPLDPFSKTSTWKT